MKVHQGRATRWWEEDGGMRKGNSTGQMGGVGVDPWNFFCLPQYKCKPLLSLSTGHITALLMLWHLGLVITLYCVVPCPETNISTIRGKPLPHSSLSCFLTFNFFLFLFSFSFFFLHSLCFFRHSLVSFLLYVWLLFVCWVVCLSLSYSSFITQKCNSIVSYKIRNFSETNLRTFAEGKWTDCHKSLLFLFLSVDC